jgi:hypothetical protein
MSAPCVTGLRWNHSYCRNRTCNQEELAILIYWAKEIRILGIEIVVCRIGADIVGEHVPPCTFVLTSYRGFGATL